ncbi:MAG TPA: 4Fe-4S binding protein [Melioribacteraceae bacterium]|nr:4Fe-4S binding protein [Melioribacteraceae bacterium]
MKFIKNIEKPIQKYRLYSQLLFVLICIWIGVEFYYFIDFLENGNGGNFYRPAGVEAFLPISALMSIYYFLLTGTIHQAHPAGFFILLAVIGVSFIFGKSFCSWICPIGFISETIGETGNKIYKYFFKRTLFLPRFLDYFLRSFKYLLLGFFVYAIFFSMTVYSLKMFLDSPYNIVADIKMYLFFADISKFALYVILALFVLSIFIKGFWCRYLCPYGALLGIVSLFSPSKIKRNANTCINCSLCTKACPSRIIVEKAKTVVSDECTMCLNCVDICPVSNTLEVKDRFTDKKISKKQIALGIVVIYFVIIGFGMVTGNWNNKTTAKEYKDLYKIINSLGHPRSTSDIDKLNKEAEQNK